MNCKRLASPVNVDENVFADATIHRVLGLSGVPPRPRSGQCPSGRGRYRREGSLRAARGGRSGHRPATPQILGECCRNALEFGALRPFA